MAWLLLELLGAWAAATVEVSVAQATWQAACREWWQRALTRAVAAAVLLSGTEYALTAIFPVSVERLPRYVFTRGAALLAAPLVGFAVWSLCVNGAAGRAAFTSAGAVWLWTLGLNHLIAWPLLLLLSAGVWRDVKALPEERWASGGAAAAAPPPAEAAPKPQKRAWRLGGGNKADTELASVAVVAPPQQPQAAVTARSDNPFADGPSSVSAWGDAAGGSRGGGRATSAHAHGAW